MFAASKCDRKRKPAMVVTRFLRRQAGKKEEEKATKQRHIEDMHIEFTVSTVRIMLEFYGVHY